jgi:glycosyltransferase domain-containing protein
MVVLPTQNRPRFVARALHYYAKTRCPFPILICDSSDKDGRAELAALVRNAPLDVRLLAFEHGISINEKLTRSVAQVKSPLMVFVADDDFIVPDSMRLCAEFLHGHPEYTVAHGSAFTFAVRDAGVNGPITSVRPYRQLGSTLPTAAERLRAHFRDWSTSFYSVQRTRNVRDILASFPRLNDITACEVFYYATNVIRGKAAKLPCRYMFRQLDVAKEHVSYDTHIWADAPGWPVVRDVLVQEIARELSAAGGPDLSDAAALASAWLAEWIEGRRPYSWRRWRAYPLRYYWERTQNLGHKLGLRMREFRRPSPEGRIVRSVVEAHA